MEGEVRQILRCAVNVEPSPAIKPGSRIAARFTDIGLDMPLPELHGQSIDPVTFVNGATLATRVTRHFEDLPSPVVNPWE